MRSFVVGALLALNGLAIYLGGSDVGFTSSLITVIFIAGYLAFSFARDGMWSDRRGPDDPDPGDTHEGDDMVHRSRARPP
jgi:hypothetical protein